MSTTTRLVAMILTAEGSGRNSRMSSTGTDGEAILRFRQLEDKWRNWLREPEKQAGGTLVYCSGGCGPGSKGYKVKIDALSRNEVLRYSASLKESIENHAVQHFSSDEIEKTTQIISLTVAPQHVRTHYRLSSERGTHRMGIKEVTSFRMMGGAAAKHFPRQIQVVTLYSRCANN
jgi:hypothetical protein